MKSTIPDDCYWTYTTRCECCGDMSDLVVPKMNADKTNDGYTHEGLAAYVEGLSRNQWIDCGKCGRITLQTVVAYEHDPNRSQRS